MALGAVTGGVTLALGGATAGLAANLASYGFAVILYSRIRISEEPGATATGRRGGLIDGLRYILRSRPLTVVVGSFAFGTLAAGLVNATLPKFTAELGLGASGYGWALAALGTGMIARRSQGRSPSALSRGGCHSVSQAWDSSSSRLPGQVVPSRHCCSSWRSALQTGLSRL